MRYLQMKPIYIILSIILISCGKISPKGDIEQRIIPIEKFSQIDAKGKFRIFWVKSPQNILEIETYPNFIDNLDIKQEQNILSIKEKRETMGLGFYNLTLFSEYIPQNLVLSDSIEFNISGKIDSQDFSLKLTENSKFIGAVNTKKTKIDMQNHTLSNFKGYTDEIHLNMKDTAQVVSPYFTGNILHINAYNGSFAEFSIKDTIKGELKNTSKLWYYDTPILKIKKEKGNEVKQNK